MISETGHLLYLHVAVFISVGTAVWLILQTVHTAVSLSALLRSDRHRRGHSRTSSSVGERSVGHASARPLSDGFHTGCRRDCRPLT